MVNDWSNHQAKSVNDLLKIMDSNLYSSESKWIYRGQADRDWRVIPSIGRLHGTVNFPTTEKLYKFEKEAYHEFFIRNYSQFRVSNKMINLAIAQHHGLKTRMLDWTFSPLIGLFFAVECEDHYDKDGILYAHENTEGYNAYNTNDSKKFDPLNSETYEQEYYFTWSPSLTERIKAQSGIFQLFENPHLDFARPFNFHKIVIPKENKGDIKRQLHRLGISYDTVYPEIDGIAKSINYYKLRGSKY